MVYWKIGSHETKSFVAAFRVLSRPRRCILPVQRNRIDFYSTQQARQYSQLTLNSVSKEPSMTSKNVVVVGGGIQGAAVAYYLSKLSKSDGNIHLNITILEAVSIAAAASGKGGGFMAKTWGAGTPTQALHEVAFDLYAEDLAPALNCTSYRKLPVLSVTPHSARGGSRSLRSPPNGVQSIFPDWLDLDKIGNVHVMGTGEDTAQITPLEVTEKMIQASHASVVYGRCTSIEREDGGNGSGIQKVTGVRFIPRLLGDAARSSEPPEILPADQIVVCAGPWSCSLVDWIQEERGDCENVVDQGCQIQLPMEGIKSTSIVFPPPGPPSEENNIDATALFCGEDDRFNTHRTYTQLPFSAVVFHYSYLSLHLLTFINQWKCIPVQMAPYIFVE
jgi:FAD dependent oxidoreductase